MHIYIIELRLFSLEEDHVEKVAKYLSNLLVVCAPCGSAFLVVKEVHCTLPWSNQRSKVFKHIIGYELRVVDFEPVNNEASNGLKDINVAALDKLIWIVEDVE